MKLRIFQKQFKKHIFFFCGKVIIGNFFETVIIFENSHQNFVFLHVLQSIYLQIFEKADLSSEVLNFVETQFPASISQL